MQPIIKDIILSISDDVVSNLTQSFEKTYYGKMNYSSKNTILDSDNKLLKETIGFEIAFIHVITYFLAYSMDFKMKFNGSTYYCELLVDNSLEEKTEYRKNISVEKLTTWFEKLNSNFGILFYYPRINRMYFYPVSNNMTLPEITDGKKIRQIKINDKCLL